MSQPEIVQSDLGDETIVARVDLGGEDELYVTPTRTLLYRAEGLLSDESVEEFPHGAERVSVSEGRRKAKVTLDYGLDGERTISLPTSRLERALKPIVEGVLRDNDVLSGEESVAQLFRFSELTIVVAGERVVRHIGPGLWDDEFESYHYSDVTDLEFEDGSVNTSVVLTVCGQRERFKTPNEDARAVRSALESTLLSYWEVESIEALRETATPDDTDTDAAESEGSEEVSFGDGPDPLFADPTEPDELPDNATRTPDDGTAQAGAAADADAVGDHGTDASGLEGEDIVQSDTGDTSVRESATDPRGAGSENTHTGADSPAQSGVERGTSDAAATGSPGGGFEGSEFEAAAPATDEQVLEEIASLREVVEQQNKELNDQRDLIERLIQELRRGR